MKKLTILLLATLVFSCKPCEEKLQSEKQNITTILDNWHKAAATANYEAYFGAMSDESILLELMPLKIGTKNNFKRLQNRILIKEKHGTLKLLNAISILVKTVKQYGLMNY
jgi:hypothetical protein